MSNRLEAGLALAEVISFHESAWLRGEKESSEGVKSALARLRKQLVRLEIPDLARGTDELKKQWSDAFLSDHHRNCCRLFCLLPENIYDLAPDERVTSGLYMDMSRIWIPISIYVLVTKIKKELRIERSLLRNAANPQHFTF